MKTILLTLAISSLFISCQKQQPIEMEEQTPKGRTTNIMQNINGKDVVHISFEFQDDFKSKVKSVTQYEYRSDGSQSWMYKLGFEYHQNTVVIFSEPLGTQIGRSVQETFVLNDQNQITAKESVDQNRTYRYNDSGYLTHINYYDDGPFMDLEYTNNNMTSTIFVGMGRTTQTFNNRARPKFIELIIDPENFRWLASVTEHILYDQGYFGKLSNNQLASITFPNKTKTTVDYGYNDTGEINRVTVNSFNGVKTYKIVND